MPSQRTLHNTISTFTVDLDIQKFSSPLSSVTRYNPGQSRISPISPSFPHGVLFQASLEPLLSSAISSQKASKPNSFHHHLYADEPQISIYDLFVNLRSAVLSECLAHTSKSPYHVPNLTHHRFPFHKSALLLCLPLFIKGNIIS